MGWAEPYQVLRNSDSINRNSFPCRTRILEVPMVNKDEAWIKQDAKSTGNLEKRMKKERGKIISPKLGIRQRNFSFSRTKMCPSIVHPVCRNLTLHK